MATKVKLIADSIVTTDQLDLTSLDSHFTGGTGVSYSSGTISIGQAVATTDNVTFADLTVTGNLNITGDINSYNVTDLDVTDKTITLGAGQIESNSGGSGIIVDGSGASILWDETNDQFDINKGISVTGEAEFANKLKVYSENNAVVAVDSLSNAYMVIDRSADDRRSALVFSTAAADVFSSPPATGTINWALGVSDSDELSGNKFAIKTGDTNFSNAQFVIDTSGNVGIGFTEPENALSVQGVISSGNSAGVAIGGTPADANTAELGPGYLNLARDDTAAAKQILFGKNGSVHSYLETTTSGLNIGGANVGIGITNPTTKLHVAGIVQVAESSNIAFYGGDYVRVFGSGQQYGFKDTGGTTKANISMAGNSYFNGGNVGIGTNNPNSKLHVENSTSDGIILRTTANVEPYIALQRNSGSNGVAVLRSIDGGDLRIDTGATGAVQSTKMTIEAGGNVGIGITQPEGNLHVDGNTVIFGDATSGYATVNFHSSTANSARYASIRKNYDSPYDMRIRASNSSGNVPIIFETSNANEAVKIDTEGLHFQRADGQEISAKESIVMTVDKDNNTASRVFQVRHGNGRVLLNLYDDYRADVGTLQYSSTNSYGATSSGSSFSGSAGDWVDVAVIPYGREIGTIKLWWDGLAAPGTAHHGNMEFKIASHYGTSYYYGWDSSINLVSSTAHNSFYISEARIITPGGGGATGYFQVKLGVAVSSGTFRAYVTERDEGCGIYPMTPAVNNSRSGTTIASLKMGTDRGITNNRLSLATSRDMHIGGGLTILTQHSFNAYSPAVTTGNNVVVFGNARHNVGGRYSTSTGRFTAGTSGKYLLTFDVLMKPTAAANYGRMLFRVNGVGNSMEQYGDNLTYQADQPTYMGLGLTAVISLDVGDYVEVYNAGQWETYGTQYGHFGGHLLG